MGHEHVTGFVETHSTADVGQWEKEMVEGPKSYSKYFFVATVDAVDNHHAHPYHAVNYDPHDTEDLNVDHGLLDNSDQNFYLDIPWACCFHCCSRCRNVLVGCRWQRELLVMGLSVFDAASLDLTCYGPHRTRDSVD